MEILLAVTANGPAIDNIQAGEVITIQPDGWGWTDAELSNPNWHIISAPILPSHANTLLMAHTRIDLQVGGVKYPRKAYLLNLSAMPNPTLFNGSRTQPMVVLQNSDVVAATAKVS